VKRVLLILLCIAVLVAGCDAGAHLIKKPRVPKSPPMLLPSAAPPVVHEPAFQTGLDVYWYACKGGDPLAGPRRSPTRPQPARQLRGHHLPVLHQRGHQPCLHHHRHPDASHARAGCRHAGEPGRVGNTPAAAGRAEPAPAHPAGEPDEPEPRPGPMACSQRRVCGQDSGQETQQQFAS
jgi:hypothetical protein